MLNGLDSDNSIDYEQHVKITFVLLFRLATTKAVTKARIYICTIKAHRGA